MKNITLIALVCFAFSLQAQFPLVAYNFDSGATDVSGNGNDGVVSPGTNTTIALKIGNNATNYVAVPTEYFDGLAEFSIAFKINFTGLHVAGSSPTNHIFSGSKAGCVQCFGFSYEKPMNAWRLAFNGTTLNWTDADVLIKKWYCISIVKIGNDITLYKNGVSLGTQTLATTIDITSFIIGQEDDCVGGCFVANQSAFAHIDNFQVLNGVKTDCTLNPNTFTEDADQKKNIEEINNDFTVHPNPSNKMIYLETSIQDQNNLSVQITDMLGKQVYFSNEFTGSISIEDLNAGLYIITLLNRNDNSLNTVTFIKN